MNKEQIAAIRERVEKASPGPWKVKKSWSPKIEGPWLDGANGPCMSIYDEGGHTVEDALFIAHARQDIPALLAYVEELEKKIEEIGEYRKHAAWERDLND